MADYYNEKMKLSHRLTGYSQALGDDIKEILEKAHERVSGKILILAEKAKKSKGVVRRKKWLEKHRLQIEKIMDEIYQEIGEAIKGKSVDLGVEGASIANTILKKSIPKEISIKLGEPFLDKKTVISWFESSEVDGLFFSEYLKKLTQSAADRIVQTTRLSMTSRENIMELAKNLQKSLDIGRHSAQALAQTSVFNAYNYAEYQYMLNNDGIIKRVKWSCELDRKTCPQCAELDGQEWPLKDIPYNPPVHIRCRCTLFPAFKDFDVEQRIARKDTQARIVHHRDGTTSTKYKKLDVDFVPGKMNYREWMESMVHSKNPADMNFAKEALGATRYRFVASGKLQINSLFYKGRLRTIKQLKELL